MKAQPFRSFWPAHSHSKLVDNASNVLVGYGPDARQSLIQVNLPGIRQFSLIQINAEGREPHLRTPAPTTSIA